MNNQLSTYATYMVLGEIKRFLRDNGPIKVSRSLKEIATKVKELQDKNVKEKGLELTVEDLMEDKETRKNIGKNSRDFSRRFIGENVIKSWYSLLDEGEVYEEEKK